MSTVPTTLLRGFNRLLWWTLASVILLLAVYVSAGRYATGLLAQHQQTVLEELNARLPVQLVVQQLRGDWQDFTPGVVLSGVRLRTAAQGDSPLLIGSVRIGVDVWSSLRGRSLQLSQLELHQLSVRLLYAADGSLQIPGLEFAGGGSFTAFWNFVMSTRRIRLSDSRVEVQTEAAGSFPLQLDLSLERSGDFRRLQAISTLEGYSDQLELIAELRGDPMRRDRLHSDAFLRAQIADVSTYQALLPALAAQSAAGRLQGEAHFGWDGQELLFAGSFDAEELLWQPSDQRPLDVSALAMKVQGKWREDAWQLDLGDVQIAQSVRHGALTRARLSHTADGFNILLQDADVGPFAEVLGSAGALPAAAASVLAELQPRGHIPTAAFLWSKRSDVSEWTLRARFRDLAVQSWNNAPGVQGADGYLELSPGVGRVFLESENLTLALPKVFSTELAYEYVAGVLDLNWSGEGFGLHSGILRTRGAEGQAVGLLRLNIPRADTGGVPEMELLLGLASTSPQYRYKYLPFALSPQLLSWLEGAFDEGRIRSGGFLWRGSLRPGDAPLRTVQLFFDVEQMALSYHPEWPVLRDARGLALVNDAQVSVWLHSGQLYDAKVSGLSVELSAEPGALGLALAGDLALQGTDFTRLLRETPLRSRLPALADWEISGLADGRLQLAMDLTDVAGSLDIRTAMQWRDAGLSIPTVPLHISDLAGELTYSTAAGLAAAELTGALWGEPVRANIATDASEAGEVMTRISVAGSAVPQRVLSHFQLPLAQRLLGSTTFSADIRIAGARSGVEIASDLSGVAVDLPEPWGKPADSSQPMALSIPLRPSVSHWQLDLDQMLNLRWDPARRVAALGLGGSPLSLPEQGMLISGGLPSLDLIATLPVIGELSAPREPQARAGGGEVWPVSIDALVVDELRLADADLGPVVIDLERDQAWNTGIYSEWFRLEAQIAGDLLSGELRFDDLDLAEWDLRKAPPAEDIDADDEDEPTEDARNWPVLAVDIARLRRGQEVLGTLQFDYQRSADAHRVDQLRGEYRGLRFSAEQPGQLVWQGRTTAAQTALKATLEFDNIGKVLHRFDYMPIVDSRSGTLELNLSWQGGPTAFTLSGAAGDVQLAMREGSFQTAPPAAAGALRVVGILNLADLVVRLDPSRPFQSGIPFDKMQAELTLGDGKLELGSLDVRGPGSRFQVAGVADLIERTQAGELIATLPVNNNLPWVAALAGGLPAAAGLFVFTRVFEKQIQQAASLRYRIGGTWDEPEVQLDALFAKPSAPTVSRVDEAAVRDPDESE